MSACGHEVGERNDVRARQDSGRAGLHDLATFRHGGLNVGHDDQGTSAQGGVPPQTRPAAVFAPKRS
jgi:hypothetical protein